MTSTAFRAADLLATFGVDTHVVYTDGGYANLGNVVAELNFLGLDEVRDTIHVGGSASLASYIKLAQAGVKFTMVIGSGATTTASITQQLQLVAALNTAVPGSVTAVEGPNEINNWPVSFNGVTGLQGAVQLQQFIYASVHANSSLAGVSVDYFTGYDSGSVATGPNPATTAGLADYDTQHPYPRNGQAPDTVLNPAITLPNEGSSPGAFVYTETGYSTYGSSRDVVSEDVQAKYLLDLFLDAAQDGSAHTYVYELMDAYAAGSAQGDDGFGLFNTDGTPKQAATAIHNLTTLLADKGTTATTFQPGSLGYSISGLPTTGHSMAIANSDGSFDLAVWNEPEIWNAATKTEVTATAVKATVQLGAVYDSVTVYDPLTGTSALQTLKDVSSVQVEVTDHPLIIKLGQVVKDGTFVDHTYDAAGKLASTVTSIYKGGVMTSQTTIGVDGSSDYKTYTSGVLTGETIWHADQSRDAYYSAMTGHTYVAEHDSYNAARVLTATTRTHADGTIDYTYALNADGSSVAHQYNATGTLLTSETLVHADKSRDVFYQNMTGHSYVAEHDGYNTAGQIQITDRTNADGSHATTVYTSGQTLVSTQGLVDSFSDLAPGNTTFSLGTQSGRDQITGFHAGAGLTHDTIQLSSALVQDYSHLQPMMSASGQDTLITFDAKDSLLLKNVAVTSLSASNFSFAVNT